MEKAVHPIHEAPEDKNNEDLQPDSLEQQTNWSGIPICHYHQFWCPTIFFQPMLSFRQNFKARDTDILIASLPKSGDTWTKSVLFTLLNRHSTPTPHSPLLSTTPHTLIPNLECSLYYTHTLIPNLECSLYYTHPTPDLEPMTPRRLFATHLPYHLLPTSLLASKAKIVYITRNPLDEFVSEREYLMNAGSGRADFEPLPVDEAFDMFCRGMHIFGPFWDNIVGYRRASREIDSGRVLFLKYEEVNTDPVSNIGKIAEFVGLPFSDEERKRGAIEEVSNLCSSFYSKCEVGGWRKHLTPAMVERLKEIMDAKMSGYGLKLDDYYKV